MSATIKLLQRYRVDRAAGATMQGPEQLVVLVLQPNEGPELAVAISRVDAMQISIALSNAAADATPGG